MSEAVVWPLAALLFPLLMIGGTWYILFIMIRAQFRSASAGKITADDNGAFNVPLVAAFGGVRGIPWLAFSRSSLSPRLVLGRDSIRYKVLRFASRPYGDVAQVDVRTTIGTVNVVIDFASTIWNFAGNTANIETAAHAVKILANRGCPLSARARNLLETHRLDFQAKASE